MGTINVTNQIKNFKKKLMKNWEGDACQELNFVTTMMKKKKTQKSTK
jgi:hypothetical protein